MSLSDYVTLPYLYKILNTKKIVPLIFGVFILFLFSPFIVNVFIPVLAVLALFFTVYMLFVLYKYDEKRWVFGFFIWMGISFLPLLFLDRDNLIAVIFFFTPHIFFFLYCMALREKIGEWILETEFLNKEHIEKLKNESNRN